MFAVPAVIGLIYAIIYGQVGAHPTSWTITAPIATYNASFFVFLRVNVVGITYSVDSFPSRAEAFLVVICAGRGIMSLGLSYATLPLIAVIGYDDTLRIQGSVTGGLSLIAVIFYFNGPRLGIRASKALGIELKGCRCGNSP
jgi:hypothetical protein